MKKLFTLFLFAASLFSFGCRENDRPTGEAMEAPSAVKEDGIDTTSYARENTQQQETQQGQDTIDVDLDTSFAPGDDDFAAGHQDTAGYVE